MKKIPSTKCIRKNNYIKSEIIMQDKNQSTRYSNKEEEDELTFLANPKSASLTTPDESMSKLAPLMSLSTHKK